MPVDPIASVAYSPDQTAAAAARPATAPDTSSTQPPASATQGPQRLQSEPQQQQTQVYFFDANLGQNVNIIV